MSIRQSTFQFAACLLFFAYGTASFAVEIPPIYFQDGVDEPTLVVDQDENSNLNLDELTDPTGDTALECDENKCAELQKKIAGAYKPVFYDNDFSYLCDPCYCDWLPGQHFKRIGLHEDGWVLDVGGQYRTRYHSENNMRGLGLTGVSDDFLLHRTRIFANLEMGSRFRAYVEYIDAVSNFEDNAPRPIEENRSDLLNAFGEMLLWDDGCQSLRARVGRQELLYGAQRLVSPLDWANTRRTFQGYKAMYHGHGWAVDGFWTNPVLPDAKNFDSPNNEEEFMGVYATNPNYHGRTQEWFYLRLEDHRPTGAFAEDFDVHTIGGRTKGKHGCYEYEVWGGYQFGENTDGSDHAAGAFTLGVGRQWECCCWKPTVWLYYDWASGGDDLGAGNGFNQLFPLAHKYLGFMDLYGRRNIESPNLLVTAQPTEKLQLLLWYYYFRLQTANDTPYTVVMTPINPASPPGSRDLGHEIDLLATYKLNQRMTVLLGYSHFFAGEYYNSTPGAATNADADFFYAQYEFNF